MKQNRNDHGAYVRKVQEGTQSFAQDVLGEIERLQMLVATLETERESEAEKARESHEVLQSNEALRALAASLEAELNRLHEQAISLRAENERHQKEQARLQVEGRMQGKIIHECLPVTPGFGLSLLPPPSGGDDTGRSRVCP
jgi:molecular chaperone GrpE (heat shock protein)